MAAGDRGKRPGMGTRGDIRMRHFLGVLAYLTIISAFFVHIANVVGTAPIGMNIDEY